MSGYDSLLYTNTLMWSKFTLTKLLIKIVWPYNLKLQDSTTQQQVFMYVIRIIMYLRHFVCLICLDELTTKKCSERISRPCIRTQSILTSYTHTHTYHVQIHQRYLIYCKLFTGFPYAVAAARGCSTLSNSISRMPL